MRTKATLSILISFILLSACSPYLCRKHEPLPEIMSAIYNGNCSLAKKLIEEGTDVKVKDSEGDTALIYAAGRPDLNLDFENV